MPKKPSARKIGPDQRQYVCCRLCGRYFRAITWTHLRKEHGMSVDEYKEEFGMRFVYSDGLRSLSSRIRIRWTREVVIERLRQRHRQGKSLAYMKVAIENSSLAASATRLFGGYEGAVRAAGYDYRKLYPIPNQRKWTDDRILNTIRQYHRENRPLNPKEVMQYGGGLYSSATRYMGSWEAAVERAGISYKKIRGNRKWTKAKVVQALRRHENREGGIPNYLRTAVNRYFGSIAKARSATGLKSSARAKRVGP